jgi:TonB-dependent starch-binding outer membrane protein SusC
VYVNGQNLLLFTDYSGFDPEVDTDKNLNGVPSAGIDYLSYPRAKTIALGVNLTF